MSETTTHLLPGVHAIRLIVYFSRATPNNISYIYVCVFISSCTTRVVLSSFVLYYYYYSLCTCIYICIRRRRKLAHSKAARRHDQVLILRASFTFYRYIYIHVPRPVAHCLLASIITTVIIIITTTAGGMSTTGCPPSERPSFISFRVFPYTPQAPTASVCLRYERARTRGRRDFRLTTAYDEGRGLTDNLRNYGNAFRVSPTGSVRIDFRVFKPCFGGVFETIFSRHVF